MAYAPAQLSGPITRPVELPAGGDTGRDSPAVTPPQGRFWAELAAVGAVVLLVFAGIDRLLVPRFERWLVAGQVVDVQSPSMLYAKLDYLRRHDGFRAVVLGDSVTLGLCLREHGDPDWREHHLAALLEKRLKEEHPGQDVLVMNLALNGALPADLACLAKLLAAAPPDLVVCDVGLRGFSTDFNDPATSLTREWLARLNIAPDGSCGLEPPPGGGWSDRLQASLWGRWRLYRLADLCQQVVFQGQPKDWARDLRGRFDKFCRERGRGGAPPHDDSADLVLLMQAKNRYSHIRLSADDVQTRAFDSFLNELHEHHWPTLLFYARENPGVLPSLISQADYQGLRGELDALLKPYLSPTLRFSEGLDLEERHYLDHVHIDAEGYQKLLDCLWPEISAMTGCY